MAMKTMYAVVDTETNTILQERGRDELMVFDTKNLADLSRSLRRSREQEKHGINAGGFYKVAQLRVPYVRTNGGVLRRYIQGMKTDMFVNPNTVGMGTFAVGVLMTLATVLFGQPLTDTFGAVGITAMIMGLFGFFGGASISAPRKEEKVLLDQIDLSSMKVL